MNKMRTTNFHSIILMTVVFSLFSGLSAKIQSSYIGCYDRKALNNRLGAIDPLNTGERCKRRCSANSLRYAATQLNLCLCGDGLNDEFATAKKCFAECPGNKNENCGGLYGQMSFYEIWGISVSKLAATTKTTKETTAKTKEAKTAAKATIRTKATNTAVTVETTITKSIINSEVTSVKPASGKTAVTETVKDDKSFERTDGEQGNHMGLYMSIPATVSVIGIVAVIIFWIYRRTKRSPNSKGASQVNQSCIVTDTAVKLTKDDDSVNIYDQCGEVYRSNSSYITPVMHNRQYCDSYDNRNYETPVLNSTNSCENRDYETPISSKCLPQIGGAECQNKTSRETGKGDHKYDSILPKCGCSESEYETLKHGRNT